MKFGVLTYTLPSILSGVLMLGACAAPSTRYYTGTPQEIHREAQYQSRSVKTHGKERNIDAAKLSPRQRKALEQRFARVAKRIVPAGRALCADLRGDPTQCTFKMVLNAKEKGINAYADGNRIVASYDLVAFAAQDKELAIVLGHEYAHNVLNHVDAQKNNAMLGGLLGTAVDQLATSQGLATGDLFSQLGARQGMLKHSQGFEAEADYVGLYITARAGYNIRGASAFWRRMGRAFPNSIYTTSTHPTSASRFVSLKKTENEISNKQRRGQPLLPEFRKQ